MKQELRDTAFTLRIHIGITRSGQAFLETDAVENVLGDVPHRQCMNSAANLAYKILLTFMNEHFGSEIPKEVVAEVVAAKEDDDLVSFFDRVRDISDE